MKNDQQLIEITPELISRFILGKTTTEEWFAVQAAIRTNPEIKEIVTASLQINEVVDSNKKSISPSPTNKKVKLSEEVSELANYIAENDHEQWAKISKDNGWTYGKKQDERNKKTPYLIPYAELKKTYQNKNRAIAVNTLKILQKQGYMITRKRSNFIYTPNSRDEQGNYIPSPVNLRGVRMPSHLSDITDYIAENTNHDHLKAKNTIRFILKLGYSIEK